MAQRNVRTRSTSRLQKDSSYYNLISNGHYEYGSQAHKIYENVEYEYPRRTTTQYIPRKNERVKSQQPTQTHDTQARREPSKRGRANVEIAMGLKEKTSATTYAIAIIISSCAILSLVLMAFVSQKKVAINMLRAELKEAERETTAIYANLYDGYDLEEIARIATTKLMMGKPEEHQIIRISAPKQSYIVQFEDAPKKKGDKVTLSNVYNLLFEE